MSHTTETYKIELTVDELKTAIYALKSQVKQLKQCGCHNHAEEPEMLANLLEHINTYGAQ